MAKNLIPKIAKLLGVEVGEEFKVKGDGDELTYRFDSDGLKLTHDSGIELAQYYLRLFAKKWVRKRGGEE